MIQLVRTAALLSALAAVAPAAAQSGAPADPAQGSGAAAAPATPTAPPAEVLSSQAELMAQAQRLRMLDVGDVQVVKLDAAQAAQLSAGAGAGGEQQQPPAAATGDQAAAEPGQTAAPGDFLASFVEDTLNQIPVVQTALQASDVTAGEVLRIDIHDNNAVTIYAGSGL